ncbi:MAG: TetR/AcrR family transcriptional regulator [Thermomicrobiales bacterium]
MPKHASSDRKQGLRASDWVRVARVVIAEKGVAAVAVEPLAKRLGVTKGSFYWHFPNRDALLRVALEHWEQEETEAVIVAMDRIPDPRDRFSRLFDLSIRGHVYDTGSAVATLRAEAAFELAISDAADDPIVQPVLQRVTERRIDYLADCFRTLGFRPDHARSRALLAYAAFLGFQRLLREAPSRLPLGHDLAAYHERVVALLIAPDETSP